jgi:hypothetical protein
MKTTEAISLHIELVQKNVYFQRMGSDCTFQTTGVQKAIVIFRMLTLQCYSMLTYF